MLQREQKIPDLFLSISLVLANPNICKQTNKQKKTNPKKNKRNPQLFSNLKIPGSAWNVRVQTYQNSLPLLESFTYVSSSYNLKYVYLKNVLPQ